MYNHSTENGDLLSEFKRESTVVMSPRFGITTSRMLNAKIRNICRMEKPRYAMVNSVVAATAIKPLRTNGIPVISLIHEFSAYIRPLSTLDVVAKWSNKLIFSSDLTKNDALTRCPHLNEANITVIPQGKCILPKGLRSMKDGGREN